MHPEAEQNDSSGFYIPVGSRRKFFHWMTGIAVSLIGVGLAIPLVGYVISPAFKRNGSVFDCIRGCITRRDRSGVSGNLAQHRKVMRSRLQRRSTHAGSL